MESLKWTEGTFMRKTRGGFVEQRALLSEIVLSKYGRSPRRAFIFTVEDEGRKWISEVRAIEQDGTVSSGVISSIEKATKKDIIEAAEWDLGTMSGAIVI